MGAHVAGSVNEQEAGPFPLRHRHQHRRRAIGLREIAAFVMQVGHGGMAGDMQMAQAIGQPAHASGTSEKRMPWLVTARSPFASASSANWV